MFKYLKTLSFLASFALLGMSCGDGKNNNQANQPPNAAKTQESTIKPAEGFHSSFFKELDDIGTDIANIAKEKVAPRVEELTQQVKEKLSEAERVAHEKELKMQAEADAKRREIKNNILQKLEKAQDRLNAMKESTLETENDIRLETKNILHERIQKLRERLNELDSKIVH